jgi:sRNA-binding protein
MLESSDLRDTGAAPDAAINERAPVPELSPTACAARLAELFPAVFTPGSPKPLKLRIQADLQQRAPGVFTRKALSGFLHRHTTSTAYLRALVNAPQRIDLDGLAAGEVAAEHREAAVAELQRRRDLHDARRAAERDAQRAAERAAQDEARRARLQQDEQRRERQALLRAFEASTLTRRNFCALKGLSETELDAMLALARQEPALAEAGPVLDRARARAQAPSAPSRNFPNRNKGPS